MKTAVIGIGNPLRGDDGVGVEVIRRLREGGPIEADLIDGGTDGLSLVERMRDYERVIIVDAVDAGKRPGEVFAFAPEEASILIRKDALSTHGLGLAEALALAQAISIPTRIRLVAVQPEHLTMGKGFSKPVADSLDSLIEVVLAEAGFNLSSSPRC
jgi:hydrogenase maturation protease